MATAKTLEAAMQEALAARGMQSVPAMGLATRPMPTGPDDLRNALSAPGTPENYQIMVPPDFDRDAALETKARQWFHRAGLPQGAVNGIVDAYCRHLCDGATGNEGKLAQAETELKQEWGADYPRKIAAAQSLIAKCGGAEELAEICGSTGLGNDAWLIRTLAAIAEMNPQPGVAQ
ncbi:hypothetical protein [Dongia rigui]|uniref:Uncharacterized protein n=1 Tax=Dongia rigui TaxID=940149 RepID=A0ABU5DYV6_9PROT|nr:hypothetical protein [Dongia rigui]MDY0872517.1 hypothetical protein [Dongia rigui]